MERGIDVHQVRAVLLVQSGLHRRIEYHGPEDDLVVHHGDPRTQHLDTEPFGAAIPEFSLSALKS